MFRTRQLALLAILGAALICNAANAAGKSERWMRTEVIDEKTTHPGVLYFTGQALYCEALIDGHWVGRYWSSDGRIKPQDVGFIHSETQSHGATVDAFELELGGQSLNGGWQFAGLTQSDDQRERGLHVIVELRNTLRPITLKVHTVLDGTIVLTRWLELVNQSDQPVPLTRISPWAGRLWTVPGSRQLLPAGGETIFDLGYFSGSYWAWEGNFEWIPLRGVTTSLAGKRGAGGDTPFFVLRNNAVGEYFIGQLAWSANYSIDFDCEQEPADTIDHVLQIHHKADPYLNFKASPAAPAPLRVIAPKEAVASPRMHLGNLHGDLNAAVQAMHEHVRQTVLPPEPKGRELLVEYDAGGFSGGYTAGHFSTEDILKDIDLAKALGAEVYILDSGWWDTFGTWRPSKTRLPQGLDPIIKHVHEQGMLFGLYIEAERADATQSEVARAHPDWIGPQPSQLLNLYRPEVVTWLEQELSRFIEDYSVDLFRVDFNPGYPGDWTSTERNGFQENNYWRYYEQVYALYDRLREKYPNVLFQQAAEGGKRNDLGIAGRFHETYLTDGLQTPRVLRNYCGQSMGLPPEIFVIGLGVPLPLDYRGPLDTHLRATYSLSRPFILSGVGPNLESLSPYRLQRYQHYAQLYKDSIRPVLAKAKVFHHAPISDDGGVMSSPWFSMEFADPDQSRGWATIIRMTQSSDPVYVLKPRGLDRGRQYSVTFDSSNQTTVLSGNALMNDGLEVRLDAVMDSELVLFKAESTK